MSKEEKKHDELESVEQALSATERFIENNQKKILTGVGAIVLVVLVVLSVRNFYLQPREIEAQNELSKAQALFAVDSFRIALDGKGELIGFKDIASDYSFTKSGKLASAYAGICSFKLGKFEDAIDFLSKYSGDEINFNTSINGLIGDCYVELNNMDKAISYFEKAINEKNEVLSPIYMKKAALVYESQSKPEEAEKLYLAIKEKYPKSTESMDIDKYIARVQK